MFAVIWHKYNIHSGPSLATIGPVVSKEFRDNKRWQADTSQIPILYVCAAFALLLVLISNVTAIIIMREKLHKQYR